MIELEENAHVQKCQFLLIPSDNQDMFLTYFCQNSYFKTYFSLPSWNLVCVRHKNLKICFQTVPFSIGIPFKSRQIEASMQRRRWNDVMCLLGPEFAHKKVFLNTLHNSQENTCNGVSFLIKFQTSGFLKGRLWQPCPRSTI